MGSDGFGGQSDPARDSFVSIRLSIHDFNACDRTLDSRALDEFANGIENAGDITF